MIRNMFESWTNLRILTLCAIMMLPACSNGGAKDAPVWYKDADRDGYSDGTTLRQFERPEGYRALSGISAEVFDCDDENSDRYPGNKEITDDHIDQDCTELDLRTWYADNDLDGYSEDNIGVVSEEEPFDRSVKYFRPLSEINEIGTDCDDNNPFVNPGAYDTDDSYLDLDCNGNNGHPVFRDGNIAWEGDYIIKSASGVTRTGLITEITGSLVIDPGYDLNDLSGLQFLKKIGKDLIISNNATLTNLSGLNNLSRVGQHIRIYNNSCLVSLQGLENLQEIGGEFEVFNCTALTEIDNLKALTTLKGVTVMNNPLLNELDLCLGSEFLDMIDGDIVLLNNDGLSRFNFNRKIRVAGTVTISNNQSLLESHIGSVFDEYVETESQEDDWFQTDHNLNEKDTRNVFYGDYTISSREDVERLVGCEWITGSLKITNVNTLDGLERLKRIGHDLVVSETGLTDLTGLRNLSFVGRNILICPEVVNKLWDSNNTRLESLDGLEHLEKINGTLILYMNSKLADLSGLGNVRAVGGDILIVGNNSLTDLSVLSNISVVGDSLWRRSVEFQETIKMYVLFAQIYLLSQNTNLGKSFFSSPIVLDFLLGYPLGGNIAICFNGSLERVSAFNGIETVTGSLVILQNDMLKEIDGFSNIRFVERSLMINGNVSLEEMRSLENIAGIGGDLIIEKNSILRDMTPFNQIQSLGRGLRIGYNDSLLSLEGLNALSRVSSGLEITGNPVLVSCDGLENLSLVGDYFRIFSNPLLTDLSGFESLCSVGMASDHQDGKIRIADNPSLLSDEIDAFLDRIRTCGNISGTPDITGNGGLQ